MRTFSPIMRVIGTWVPITDITKEEERNSMASSSRNTRTGGKSTITNDYPLFPENGNTQNP